MAKSVSGWWGLAVLGAAAFTLGSVLWWAERQQEDQLWSEHREHVKLGLVDDTRQRLQFFFHNTYETARTISLIPGVREVTGANRASAAEDVVAQKRLDHPSDVVIRNLYLNLVSNFTISEIYCVLDGFQSSQVPFFMYDSSIVGETSRTTSADPADVPVPDETAEYQYFPQVLDQLRQNHPESTGSNLADIPVVVSPPMVTCDNSQYLSKKDGDPKHTEGLVATVPLYDPKGHFHGVIAVIYRLDTLRALLLGLRVLPVTEAEQKAGLAEGYDPRGQAVPLVLHLPSLNLTVADPRPASPSPVVEELAVPFSAPGFEGAELKYQFTAAERDQALATPRQGLAFQWAALAALTLVALGVGVLITVARKRRFQLMDRVTTSLLALGDGQLGTTLALGERARGPEADLGRAFVAMADSLRETVRVLTGTLETTSAVSHDLASSSVEASATLDQIQRSLVSIGEVVVALESLVTETMEANFQHAQAESVVSTQVTGLVSRLDMTASYVESSLTSFQAASETMSKQSERLRQFRSGSRQAREQIDQSSEHLVKVEAQMARISEAVGLISDITAKTKVLAINAAIEAARAGSAGAGFGVVSQNIRALAEETEGRSSSITQILVELQGALGGARSAQDWTRDHLASLLSDFESLGQDLADVSENMVELGQGSQEVLGELTKTRDGSRQVVEALELMTEQSGHLVTKIGELVDLAQTTTTETRAVESALKGVGEVVQLVSNAGETNLAEVGKLKEQLGRFQT